MSKKQANFVCLFVAIVWGGGFIATDAALNTFSPFYVLAIRFSGASLISLILCAALRCHFSWDILKKGFVCGLCMFLAFAFQTFGLALTETGSNAFLTAVNVVLVPYVAWLAFRRRPKINAVIASVICLAGIGCLSLSEGFFRFRFGDLLSLACAFFFAAQIVALEWAGDEDAMAINAVQMITSALLSIPCALLLESWPSHIGMSAVFSCIYMIAIATWLAFFLQTYAQKYTDASSASLLLCTESLWANIFGWILLHEHKSAMMIFGGVLIFTSILIVEGAPLLEKISFKFLKTQK
jgi:drug/metabolite transporter (DMT)-like permease